MKQITVVARRDLDLLAKVSQVLADRGINIESLDSENTDEHSIIILMVGEYDEALAALRDEGFNAVSEEAIVVRLRDEPGAVVQMSIYAWALGIEQVAFVSLCKTKVPKVELVSATIPPAQQAWAVRVVEDVIGAIQAGIFPRTDPSSWICSQKFCGHWGRCRGCAVASAAAA